MTRSHLSLWILLGSITCCSSGCTGLVTGKLADTLAAPGTVYASDNDPDLIRGAVPFGLKTMEQVLPSQPRHVPLLTALASNFTEYAYAFVEQDADRLEDHDMAAARALRARAGRLYLRARDYGLRALDVHHPGLAQVLRAAPSPSQTVALQQTSRADVPLLYWSAAPWILAIAVDKSNMALVGSLPTVEAMMARAMTLDESFDEGALHEFYISYEGGRDAAGAKSARQHLDRALELSHNKKLGPLVSFAETVSVSTQNRAEFVRLLEQVLNYHVDDDPPHRLANIIAQTRARWLLDRQNELFAD